MNATEKIFIDILNQPDTDTFINVEKDYYNSFINELYSTIDLAYKENNDDAHLTLQRILYRINRLKMFWYDDLDNYKNENSLFLLDVRNKIEKSWQEWELSQLPVNKIKQTPNVIDYLRNICSKDLEETQPAEHQLYLKDQLDINGYKKILEIFSIDALAEASWMGWTIAGQVSPVQTILSKIFIEEYGNGKVQFKHSNYFKNMLEEAGLNVTPEYYLDSVTWEFLATVNQMLMLSTWKQMYLRFIGSFLYMELNTPAGFKYYSGAANRLNINNDQKSYWNIHIIEDKRHGEWMLNEAAVPMAEMYPDRAWEIIVGYEQHRNMSSRSGVSVVKAAKKAEELAKSNIDSNILLKR